MGVPTFYLSSGKWYCEVATLSGSSSSSSHNYAFYVNDSLPGGANETWGYNYVNMTWANGGNSANVFGIWTDTDGTVTQPTGSRPDAVAVVGIAIDVDNGNVEYYINGTLNGKCLGITNFTKPLHVGLAYATSTITAASNAQVINFGQNGAFSGHVSAGGNSDVNGIGNFKYTPPTNYLAMCVANLPTPAVALPEEHFNTVLWTGADTSAAKSVTGVGFQPDIVWSKSRTDAFWHNVYDAVRGVGKRLISNDVTVEATNHAYGYLSAFDADGFTTVAGSTNNENWNKTSSNYYAWNWKAGGAGSVDTSKDIDATVSANTTAGISIVKWVGNSVNAATVPHGLGVTPEVIIYKAPNQAWDWTVWFTAHDGSNDYLILNDNDALVDNSAAYGSPTSSTISNYGFGSYNVLAYCFAEIEGFSNFGTYRGNGSADGPFVYTGFRPAWVVIKQTNTAAEAWYTQDSVRSPYNEVKDYVQLEVPAAEYNTTGKDFLANGFKLRNTWGGQNTTNYIYFYMAFAEAPFKYANAR